MVPMKVNGSLRFVKSSKILNLDVRKRWFTFLLMMPCGRPRSWKLSCFCIWFMSSKCQNSLFSYAPAQGLELGAFYSQMLLSRSLSSEPFTVTWRSRQSKVFVRTSFNFRKSVTTLSGFSDVTVTPPYQNHHFFWKMRDVVAKIKTFTRKWYTSLLKSRLLLENKISPY